jgi:hypothetical protein
MRKGGWRKLLIYATIIAKCAQASPAGIDFHPPWSWEDLTEIPKFGLVVVVLRPRCAGVFFSEKSPIVPQLFCSVILIVKHPDFRGRRRARGGGLNFGV